MSETNRLCAVAFCMNPVAPNRTHRYCEKHYRTHVPFGLEKCPNCNRPKAVSINQVGDGAFCWANQDKCVELQREALLAKYRAAIEAADRMRPELYALLTVKGESRAVVQAYDRARSALPDRDGG